MMALLRREVIKLLGGAAVQPLAARAQQRQRLPTIGFLGSSTPAGWAPWTAAFQQRLRELGRIEGGNIAIEYRWAEGRNERGAEIADEFARLKVEVIVTTGSSALAVKNAIATVPVIFALWADLSLRIPQSFASANNLLNSVTTRFAMYGWPRPSACANLGSGWRELAKARKVKVTPL
jgi:hypothetical protein